jgi:hypothetical protein
MKNWTANARKTIPAPKMKEAPFGTIVRLSISCPKKIETDKQATVIIRQTVAILRTRGLIRSLQRCGTS